MRTYGSLQGGQRLDQLFRVGGGTGSVGNPNLIPYKSKNIDLSAEWYYCNESYISVGYFHKNVANYIGNTVVNTKIAGVTSPTTTFNGVTQNGPRYQAALNALGANATFRADSRLHRHQLSGRRCQRDDRRTAQRPAGELRHPDAI